jgi:hypothetical protein
LNSLRQRLAALPVDLDSHQLDQLELFIKEDRRRLLGAVNVVLADARAEGETVVGVDPEFLNCVDGLDVN